MVSNPLGWKGLRPSCSDGGRSSVDVAGCAACGVAVNLKCRARMPQPLSQRPRETGSARAAIRHERNMFHVRLLGVACRRRATPNARRAMCWPIVIVVRLVGGAGYQRHDRSIGDHQRPGPTHSPQRVNDALVLLSQSPPVRFGVREYRAVQVPTDPGSHDHDIGRDAHLPYPLAT
jgi:hypothetical protein